MTCLRCSLEASEISVLLELSNLIDSDSSFNDLLLVFCEVTDVLV